jgi:hypothetical protein
MAALPTHANACGCDCINGGARQLGRMLQPWLAELWCAFLTTVPLDVCSCSAEEQLEVETYLKATRERLLVCGAASVCSCECAGQCASAYCISQPERACWSLCPLLPLIPLRPPPPPGAPW